MTSRFDKIKNRKHPIFIPFIVAGDPTPNVTVDLALSLEKAGADVLELGIPYSDPLADGPVIQKAAIRALKQQMTIEKAMNLVGEMRNKGLTIPVVIFTYYNLVLQLGIAQFSQLAHQNDIDGLLIPDLPFEESGAVRQICKENNVKNISLVAPTTSNKRLMEIASEAEGFLYAVSSLGVTGERQQFHARLIEFLEKAVEYAKVPVALGFGVSTKQQFEAFSSLCDGVVIGSAIVRKIESLRQELLNKETEEVALERFRSYITSIVGERYPQL